MYTIPEYWKSSLEDIEKSVESVKKGNVKKICDSAGGRPVYRIFYGTENVLSKKANLSSALGAADFSCYADKSSPDYIPTLCLVGCIHGGEFEGTVAILNLINLIENGCDLAGNEFGELLELTKKVNLVLIPCMNPDGRSKIDFPSFVGKTFADLRYYNQGTWKDGSLCNWPDCKKIHPIKDYVDVLGAYFNDDGINLMHDDFLLNPSSEVTAVLKELDKYVPDFSVLLHGGAETVNSFFRLDYVSVQSLNKVVSFEKQIAKRAIKEGLNFKIGSETWVPDDPFVSFNLTSAMHQVCGEPCVVYETNQGLKGEEGSLTHDEIYKHHILLFEELCKFITQKKEEK